MYITIGTSRQTRRLTGFDAAYSGHAGPTVRATVQINPYKNQDGNDLLDSPFPSLGSRVAANEIQ